jgi:predicted nucleotidyltransferase
VAGPTAPSPLAPTPLAPTRSRLLQPASKMDDETISPDELILQLREREKELRCLYRVRSITRRRPELSELFDEVVRALPAGWQFPERCVVRIRFEGFSYSVSPWPEGAASMGASIRVEDRALGVIELAYVGSEPGDGSFLDEERELLSAIADVLGDYVFDRRLERSVRLLQEGQGQPAGPLVDASSHGAHARWRFRMAEAVARCVDFEAHGILAVYLIGSAKTGEAGPASDIDLIVHLERDGPERALLDQWFAGCSAALAELNFDRTGIPLPGLLDVHYITDTEIEAQTSYAVMLDATTNGARCLRKRGEDE